MPIPRCRDDRVGQLLDRAERPGKANGQIVESGGQFIARRPLLESRLECLRPLRQRHGAERRRHALQRMQRALGAAPVAGGQQAAGFIDAAALIGTQAARQALSQRAVAIETPQRCRQVEILARSQQFATHQAHQAQADHQSQAAAAIATTGRTLGLAKAFEDQLQLVPGDADAAVAHREFQPHAFPALAEGTDDEHHLIMFGELDGVASNLNPQVDRPKTP